MTTPVAANFGEHIGIETAERGEGRSVLHLEVRPHHFNGGGVVHGGVTYSVVDQGMAAAVFSVLEPGEWCATIEITIVYLAAIREGNIDCETRVINRGRRVVALESEVHSGEQLVAKALGTYAVFERRQA